MVVVDQIRRELDATQRIARIRAKMPDRVVMPVWSGFETLDDGVRERCRQCGDAAAFQKAAQEAKSGCPVSKVLKAEITMTAKLES